MGAGCAGLSAAVHLAEKLESACCAGRVVIYVWDGRLQRLGLRRRRVAFREAADDDKAPQVRLALPDTVILVPPCCKACGTPIVFIASAASITH